MVDCRLIWCIIALLCPVLPSLGQADKQALITQLDAIAQDDQRYRNDSLRQTTTSQQEDDANMAKQAVLDRFNLTKIERIIARYGYPGRSLVGEQRQAIAFIVIQHSELETQEKYLPLLTEAAAKGELKAASLAILTDRVRVGRGQKQLYGSQLRETKQGVKVMPIEDEAQVNQRRAAVGLAPLEDYLRHWHIVYQVPTADHANPDSVYYNPAAAAPASVDLIGGWDNLYQRIICPPATKGLKGSVTVQLTIDKHGLPQDLQVVRSLGAAYDKEALRVLSQARFINPLGEDHEIRANLPFSCSR